MRVVAPACLEGDVELLFELQLACFYKLAAEGRTAEAVRFSRSHLTPLTQDQPHLVPQVKVTPFSSFVILQSDFRSVIFGCGWHHMATDRLERVQGLGSVLHDVCASCRLCLAIVVRPWCSLCDGLRSKLL